MFGNGGGFGFNVSFVDRASIFVESVFETASLSFSYVLYVDHVDQIFGVTGCVK